MAYDYLVHGQDISPDVVGELENELFWMFVNGDREAGDLNKQLTDAIKAPRCDWHYEADIADAVKAAREFLAKKG